MNALLRRRLLVATALFFAPAFAACNRGPTDPVTAVTGEYVATTLELTEGGSTRNLLAEGASLEVDLDTSHDFDGRFRGPAGEAAGSRLATISLDGQWMFSTFDRATMVTLTPRQRGLFGRDLVLVVKEKTLEGEGGGLRVVLGRR